MARFISGSAANLITITGRKDVSQKKAISGDGYIIGIPGVRLGADAFAADDKGPYFPFLGVGRLLVLGLC